MPSENCQKIKSLIGFQSVLSFVDDFEPLSTGFYAQTFGIMFTEKIPNKNFRAIFSLFLISSETA